MYTTTSRAAHAGSSECKPPKRARIGKLMAVVLATAFLGTVTGLVDTVCGEVEEEFYESFLRTPWDLCRKVVQKNYEACDRESGYSGLLTCSVTWCQDQNWCEVAYPCAETVPLPGTDLLDCSTTVSKEPQFSARGLGSDKHMFESLTEALAEEALPGEAQKVIILWKGFGPVVGSVDQLLSEHGKGPRDTAKIARWILRSQPWLTSAQVSAARTFGSAGTGCVGKCGTDS